MIFFIIFRKHRQGRSTVMWGITNGHKAVSKCPLHSDYLWSPSPIWHTGNPQVEIFIQFLKIHTLHALILYRDSSEATSASATSKTVCLCHADLKEKERSCLQWLLTMAQTLVFNCAHLRKYQEKRNSTPAHTDLHETCACHENKAHCVCLYT